jgi:hypothetical protein
MNKILRYSFVALLAMVFAPSFAEDIIWQEDFSSYAADAVPSGGDYGYACENGGGTTKVYSDNLAGGTAPELLVAKSQGSFSATIPLNGKSGIISLSFLTNRDDLKVEITGGELGENAGPSTKSRIYPITVASGTASLTIKFYMSTKSNARLDNIKLYQGTAKKPAGLSWGKASTTVTFGEDYSNIPTLQNPNELAVECTSDNAEVCTVTNAGVITVVGAGDANISAAFEGNDEYEAQTVSIKITVKPAIDPDAKGQKNNPYLITDEDFLTLAGSLKPEDETSTASSNPKSDKIYVKGYIVDIDDVTPEDLEQYGNMTFKIAAVKGDYDAEIKLKAYRCKYLENAKFTSADQIAKDDEVVITGQIQWYGGSPQFVSGCNIYSIVKAQPETQGQSWDFTQWSAETVANLIADAAASKLEGWSDVEKKTDAEAGAEPTEAAKDNCFWFAGTVNEDGSLSANGAVIKELKGLKFDSDYATKRSLAIAVNYPSTSLGDYAGGAYLWLGGGGSKQTCPCFTIPGVKAGSKITVELESHKPSDGRGIGLYKNSYAAENLIGEQFKPTAKEAKTWEIAEDCDVVVWNTSGCHIYTLKVEEGTSVGISTVKVAAQNGVRYNLAGQKVDNSYKGVVIVNGKKMLQK